MRDAKADARENAIRLDRLEARQAVVAARIQERRDQISAIKQGLINTRVGYDNTRAGKQRALISVRYERRQLEGALSQMKETQARISRSSTRRPHGTFPPARSAAAPGAMIWPVNGPITSPFCEPRAWEACHPGIDIGVADRHADPRRRRRARRDRRMDGRLRQLHVHPAHRHRCPPATATSRASGQRRPAVSQGQVIGARRDAPASASAPHLHFEVRINGAVTNPMNYL